MDLNNDIENGPAAAGGMGSSPADESAGVPPDADMDDMPVHDQLPSVEEYKANVAAGTTVTSPRTTTPDNDTSADNEDAPVHDQLPALDEVAAYRGAEASSGGLSGYSTFLLLIMLTLLATAIILPLVLTDGGSNSPPAVTLRDVDVVQYLSDRGITSFALLDDPETPQYKAARWIADEDPLQMDIPASDKKYNPFVERYVLAVIYFSTAGPWSHDVNFVTYFSNCNWYQTWVMPGTLYRQGVVDCVNLAEGDDNESGRYVSGLELADLALEGEIPPEVEYLHQLREFVMAVNPKLTGSLPASMAKLTRLTDLRVQHCDLEGAVPNWIGQLTALTQLGLGDNSFTGAFPASLSDLTKMEVLGIDDNNLGGSLLAFEKMSNLRLLYAQDNLLTGEITESLVDKLSKLSFVDLSDNLIETELPANLFRMTDLIVLDLHGNAVTGNLPDITLANDKLQFLALHDNRLDGTIPEGLGNLIKLVHLDLSFNHFVLPFPSTMNKLTDLRYLFTGHNDFEDHDLPNFVTKLTNLEDLSMKHNSLTGEIPSTIASLTDLTLLDLDDNKLTGTIPGNLGLLTDLVIVQLNRNLLTGDIPASFTLMNKLQVLMLDGNDFNGTVNAVCDDPPPVIHQYTADCGDPDEVKCECCTLCCHDGDPTCNDQVWHWNLDPSWEYDFQRDGYVYYKKDPGEAP